MRVPDTFNEPEEFKWPGDPNEMPGIKFVIDSPSQEVPDEKTNAFYRSRTPEGNAAVERELLKPARDAVMWLKNKGWISDPSKIDDYVQDVVLGMMARTGAVPNWRSNVGFRRTTASMLARRYASQGWPSASKERTGHLIGDEGREGALDTAADSKRQGGEDQFSRVQGGAALRQGCDPKGHRLRSGHQYLQHGRRQNRVRSTPLIRSAIPIMQSGH